MTQDVSIEPHPAHFVAASMIAAQMCVRCGSLVGGEKKQEHLDFHRKIEELEIALNRETAATLAPGPGSKKPGKKEKK